MLHYSIRRNMIYLVLGVHGITCKILTSLSYIIGTEFRFVRNCMFLNEYSIV
jgi:hypothetical protein